MENETGKKEINVLIQELRAKGCTNNAILKLAADDLEYGLTKEQIMRYALKNWKIERIEMYSKALHMTEDEDFLSLLENGNFNAEQMAVLLRFMEKGMPAQQIQSATDSEMKPHAMQKALEKVYEAQKQTQIAAQKEPYFIKQVQERIQSMVNDIGANQDYLKQVMEKLGSIDQLQKDSDDVRESLTAVLEQRDRELEEQQKSNNKLAVECAELRTKYSALLEQQKSLDGEKAEFEKEKNILRSEKETLLREKNQLAQENELLRKEKSDMEKQLQTWKTKETEQRAIPEKQDTASQAGVAVNEEFIVPVKGSRNTVRVEREVSRTPERLLALAGHKFFKGKSKINLIKQLTGKGLNQAQMEQVKVAIQSGLDEQEVIDIINSGFSAEEMAQAIEIVVADKMYQ